MHGACNNCWLADLYNSLELSVNFPQNLLKTRLQPPLKGPWAYFPTSPSNNKFCTMVLLCVKTVKTSHTISIESLLTLRTSLGCPHVTTRSVIFDGLASWLWLLTLARGASRKHLFGQLTILCRTLCSFGSCAGFYHQTLLRLLHHHTLAGLDPEGPDVELADGIVVLGPARAKPFRVSTP